LTERGALPRVVFIGGSGRSGSTLIERVLDQLPGACSVGETVQIWEQALARGEPCGCGLPLSACPFWSQVGKLAFDGWDELDLDAQIALKVSIDRTRHLPRLALLGRPRRPPVPAGPAPSGSVLPSGHQDRSLTERADAYARSYAALYGAIGRASGSPVIIDSSKRPMLAFCLRRIPGLDLRVIHVVRDSRAVAYSWTKVVPRPEAAGEAPEAAASTGPDPGYMGTYSPARTAMRWNILNVAFHILAARGVPTLRVRYEDFVADPAGSLRRMAEFACGPDAVPPALADGLAAGHADLSVTHTAAGNPMRFRTGRIEIRRDDDWRSRLPGRDRAVAWLLTAPLLAAYRYRRR
jgi:Sulfotransferase domain